MLLNIPIDNPVGLEETIDNLVVFGAYPNPIIDEVTVQFYLFQAEECKGEIIRYGWKISIK